MYSAIQIIMAKGCVINNRAEFNLTEVYRATNRFVHIHSIQGRCGSYIGPESRGCARTEEPRCRVEELIYYLLLRGASSRASLELVFLARPTDDLGSSISGDSMHKLSLSEITAPIISHFGKDVFTTPTVLFIENWPYNRGMQ